MKIVGLIVEYNPFHNGHLHHIEESLKITGADKVIVVMSGNYVQRGTPAIMPKHLRTEIALKCGASLVIELPVRYATGSAEFFATGAVSLLHELGCVDSICFGSECGDINLLSHIADILLEEPETYRAHLQSLLKTGLSYPASRQRALALYLEQEQHTNNIHTLLSDPNNILGVEYMKALKKLNSPIFPYTITRKSSHYHDKNLQEDFSSASAIRNQIKCIPLSDSNSIICENNHLQSLETQVPSFCYDTLIKYNQLSYPIYLDDFSLLLHSKLLLVNRDILLTYQDMTVELCNRILNNRNNFMNIDQFCNLIKTKNLTHSRICRTLLHILLNIYTYKTPTPDEWNHYIHILGFRKEDQALLTVIKEKSTIPMITKLSSLDSLSSSGKEMIMEDIDASNLYECIVTNKYAVNFTHELEKSLILI